MKEQNESSENPSRDEVREPLPGYRLQSDDTSYAQERLLFDRWRRMQPHEKAAILEEMDREARNLVRAGVMLRYPNADEHEVEMRVLVQFLGPKLVREVYGWGPGRDVRQ